MKGEGQAGFLVQPSFILRKLALDLVPIFCREGGMPNTELTGDSIKLRECRRKPFLVSAPPVAPLYGRENLGLQIGTDFS